MPSPVRWQQTGGGAKEDEAVPVVALRMPPQGRHASGIHRLVMRPRDIGIRGRVAWRLASTSLWRTAAPCYSWRRPTMPTFCSRVRKRRRKPCRQGLRLRPLGKRERSRESSDIAANPVFCNGPYLTSALAPASSSFFFAASASALEMASLTGFGAPSTRSLASLSPRPVISRTALITLTLFSPYDESITVNSVCSSTAAAGAAVAGPAAATAAAADTPNFSSIALMSSDSSSTVIDDTLSRISV